MQIIDKILSFPEVVERSREAERTVLLLRHSMRRSLTPEDMDPGLTPDGALYAEECGKLIAGMDDICFGSSPRRRCVETVECLMRTGNYGAKDIASCPEIIDDSLFENDRQLTEAVAKGIVHELAHSYFTTGAAPGMLNLADVHKNLLDYLTRTEFPERNVLLSTHDIVVTSLLIPLQVYPFVPDDWCGYIHGAALFLQNGKWQAAYTAPEGENRRRCAFFV